MITRLSAIAALVVSFVLWCFYKLFTKRRAMRGLPMPPHHPILGHLLVAKEMMENVPKDAHPHHMATWLRARYNLDKVFYFDVWPLADQTLFVIDPDMANQITVGHSLLKYPLVKTYIAPVLGENNMVTLESSSWKMLRTLFNPGFSAQNLMTVVPQIVDDVIVCTDVLREKAASGKIFQLEEVATRLTIDIIGRITLGAEFNAQRTENKVVTAFRTQLATLPPARSFNPFVGLNMRRQYKLWSNGRKLTGYIGEYLDESLRRRVAAEKRGKSKAVVDLAWDMYEIEFQNTGQKGMDKTFREMAIDQIKTFIFAGHDTTSSTIAYILYFLHYYPDVQARLTAELDSVFGSDLATTISRLKSSSHLLNYLPYATAILKEVLRLFPPASSVRIGDGYILTDPTPPHKTYPTGTFMVWPVPHASHRHPAHFPRPADFLPDRWLPGERSPFPPPHRDAWRPFEKGPRHCIGEGLAMLETKVMMVLICRGFEFVPEWDPVCAGGEWWGEGEGEGEGVGEAGTGMGIGKGKGRGETFEGHRIYQVLKGTAKPKGDMPGWVRVREGFT